MLEVPVTADPCCWRGLYTWEAVVLEAVVVAALFDFTGLAGSLRIYSSTTTGTVTLRFLTASLAARFSEVVWRNSKLGPPATASSLLLFKNCSSLPKELLILSPRVRALEALTSNTERENVYNCLRASASTPVLELSSLSTSKPWTEEPINNRFKIFLAVVAWSTSRIIF